MPTCPPPSWRLGGANSGDLARGRTKPRAGRRKLGGSVVVPTQIPAVLGVGVLNFHPYLPPTPT